MRKEAKILLKRFNALINFLDKHNNELRFKIEKDKDGWIARCLEDTSIMVGNTNPNPSEKEIKELIAEVLLDAFALPHKVVKLEVKRKVTKTRKTTKKSVASPYQKHFTIKQMVCV